MRRVFVIFFFFAFVCSNAQLLFYQDTYRGGITSDGVSYWSYDYLQADTIKFQIAVPNTATIRKAFLLTLGLPWYTDPRTHSSPMLINYNGNIIAVDSSKRFSNYFSCSSSMQAAEIWVSVLDVTSLTQATNNTLITPCQSCQMSVDTTLHQAYDGFLLVVMYDDPTMPVTNSSIFLNNQGYSQNMTQALTNINPMDTSFDVGLSIWVNDAYTQVFAGQKLYYTLQSSLGSYSLGTLDGWNGTINKKTLPGSFDYQSGTLSGLVDDFPDPIVDSTDAIANISSMLSNLTTSFTLTSIGDVDGGCMDTRGAYIAVSRTPCPPVQTSIAQTYTLCSGNSIQLVAGSAGSGFKWWPSAGLNNSSSANPLASPTITTNYILTATDSNGCHHTEHHTVGVYSVPKPNSVSVIPAICGDPGGSATIAAPTTGVSPYAYNIGFGYQANNHFDSIPPGAYSYTVTDSKGCVYTSASQFTVSVTNLANAGFSIQPDTFCFGGNTYIADTSSTVNNYSWYLNGGLVTTQQYPNYSFNDTGLYIVGLIAYHNLPQCSDTVTRTIYVRNCPGDSFNLTAPNIFTPNGDGINEVWSPNIFESGHTITDFQMVIFDRWGIKVFESSNSTKIGWDGRSTSGLECVEGTYYYLISYTAQSSTQTKSETKKGYLQLIR